MDTSFESIAIGGIAVVPLVIGLIQFIKSFFPGASSNVWKALSFLFAFIGTVAVFIISQESQGPIDLSSWTFTTWATLITQSLLVGLAAGKAYDEGQSYMEARRARQLTIK